MVGIKARVFHPIEARTLEQFVPPEHVYRQLERTVDLRLVRGLVADCYAAGGRPSVDPMVLFKLQLVLFFEGIRPERQLLAITDDRLNVRW
jgi:transposase